jgi:hypothetical protein
MVVRGQDEPGVCLAASILSAVCARCGAIAGEALRAGADGLHFDVRVAICNFRRSADSM